MVEVTLFSFVPPNNSLFSDVKDLYEMTRRSSRALNLSIVSINTDVTDPKIGILWPPLQKKQSLLLLVGEKHGLHRRGGKRHI